MDSGARDADDADEPPPEAGCADEALLGELPPLALLGLLPLLEHPAKIMAAERAAAAKKDEYQERLNRHLRMIVNLLLGCVQDNTERARREKRGARGARKSQPRRE